jgi:hypothetical protein
VTFLFASDGALRPNMVSDQFVHIFVQFSYGESFVIDTVGLPKVFSKTHTLKKKNILVSAFNIVNPVNIIDTIKLA